MKAHEALAKSQASDMGYIFDWINNAAKRGETSVSLCIPVSPNQAAELKSLGYFVTWVCSDEYTGGYKVYFGTPPRIKSKQELTPIDKILDTLAFSHEYAV